MFSKKPFSHGEVLRFSGQTMTCIPGTACYRCVFAAAPVKGAVPSGSQAGILGSVPGMLGTIQATEALKYLIGTGELLTNRLLIFNALNMEFREVLVSKNQNCPICGRNPIITKLLDEV
jgi:adenylyltransferase/sulfurtransferase